MSIWKIFSATLGPLKKYLRRVNDPVAIHIRSRLFRFLPYQMSQFGFLL